MFGIKLRIKAAALITAAAAAAAVFYGCGVFTPTGDGTKNRPGEAELSESLKPVFSDLGGFYTGKMSVTISIPKALEGASCIRITYDGSEPDKDSREYKGEDIILPDASHTDTDFDDGTRNVSVSVIRAACFDGSGNMAGQIATATYIRVEDEDRFAMPVISLVTDDRNLNDTYSGIFSNPDGTGSKWERPVKLAQSRPEIVQDNRQKVVIL